METECLECGTEMKIMGVNLVNAERDIYQTMLGCTSCGAKVEVARILEIIQISRINPMTGQTMQDGIVDAELVEDTLVQF